jgi:hypothetical protein
MLPRYPTNSSCALLRPFYFGLLTIQCVAYRFGQLYTLCVMLSITKYLYAFSISPSLSFLLALVPAAYVDIRYTAVRAVLYYWINFTSTCGYFGIFY